MDDRQHEARVWDYAYKRHRNFFSGASVWDELPDVVKHAEYAVASRAVLALDVAQETGIVDPDVAEQFLETVYARLHEYPNRYIFHTPGAQAKGWDEAMRYVEAFGATTDHNPYIPEQKREDQ